MKIIGTAAVLSTELDYKNIKKVAKFDPLALVVKDDKGNEVYRVGTGNGEFNVNGVVFPSHAENGKAQLTLTLAEDLSTAEGKKDFLFAKYGKAIQAFGKYEPVIAAQMAVALEGIEAIQASITVEE